MRHLKILGLLAVTAAATMAFAASASATTITETTGGAAATPIVHFVSEEGSAAGTNHVSIHNPSANIECNATATWKVDSHGSTSTADGFLTSFSFTPCTSGWTVTVSSKGRFIIHYTSGHNGTLTSSNATIAATLNLGAFGHVTCNYVTDSSHLGTVTGGNPATVHLEGTLIFESGSQLCGGNAKITGKFKTTSALYVAP